VGAGGGDHAVAGGGRQAGRATGAGRRGRHHAARRGHDRPGWPSLLFALLGGVLLNLMPCVFPVLSLKVFGFAAHAQDRRGLLAGGLAYTAGVVLSFVALAALLLLLRAGGEQLGWGFQLQSPACSSPRWPALFTLIGLNLAGVFEFGIGAAGALVGCAGAPPAGRFVADRRAGGGRGVAVHRAVHGRVAGRWR
jgi:thiol:disulfide interchange protein